ncbi:hypothetical protein RQP46_005575 [Phenoliferia psychrophenolica]
MSPQPVPLEREFIQLPPLPAAQFADPSTPPVFVLVGLQAESTYLSSRKTLALSSLKAYLNGTLASKVYGASLDTLNETTMPTLGIAVSGGGDRAALYGAGALAALGGGDPKGAKAGLAGVLQSAAYVSALSGGSWFLSSLLFNDYPTSMYDLVLGNATTGQTGWILPINLLTPGNTSQQALVLDQIMADLTLKKDAGPFNVTYGDFWARGLSRHFLPDTSLSNFYTNDSTNHGASTLLSSATSLSSWTSHRMPFPLIVATVFSPNEKAAPFMKNTVPLQNVVYEFSPVEFGSYDPELAAFLPVEHLGTSFNAGTCTGGTVTGFDNAGYVMGISSNLWVAYNLTASPTWTAAVSPINVAWTTINSTFHSVQPNQRLDISAVPNPFRGINNGTFEDSNETQLGLMDGGLDGEVDPIAPLLVPARGVDTMIVLDSTADSALNKPTGASMVATYARSMVLPNGTQSLPPLPPSIDVYIAQGLNTRPVFFGCTGTPANLTSPSVSPFPLIIYLPNADPTGKTNTTTAQLDYNITQQNAFLDATVSLTGRGMPSTNGSADAEWSTCLACAMVERTRGRNGVSRTSACESCFGRYCWSGSLAVNGTTATGGTNGTATATATGTSGSATAAGKSAAGKVGAGWGAVGAVVAVGLAVLV